MLLTERSLSVILKVCNCCNTQLPLDEFPKASSCKDGHRNYCKHCHKTRKDAWRHKNKQRHNEKCRVWILNNPEKRKASVKRWNENNKDAVQSYHKLWRQANNNKVNIYTALRRKRVQLSTPLWADLSLIREVYQEAQYHGLEVDHIIPLKHPKVCGLHVFENLQLLTKTENCIKGNSYNFEEV